MIHWLPYCLVVAGLLAVAALALEALLMLYRRPVRWVWVGSLLGSFALPAVAWVAPALIPVRGGENSAGVGHVLAEVTLLVPAPVALSGVEPAAVATAPEWQSFLPWVWLAGSALVVLLLVIASIRLARLRRGWSQRELDGEEVLLSERIGPAVVGVLRGRIVVPAWVLGLPAGERSLVLAHESEHLRAGDHRLLVVALLTLAAMPWNPFVWWQVQRLRGALELDCDARVLRRFPDLRGYGDLLLEITRRRGARSLWLSPAVVARRRLIRRRIRAMTSTVPKHRTWKAVVLAAVAGALVAVASEAPAPQDATEGIATAASRQPTVRQVPQDLASTLVPVPPPAAPDTLGMRRAPAVTIAGPTVPPVVRDTLGVRTQQLIPPVPRHLVAPPPSADWTGTPIQVSVFVDEEGRVVADSIRLDPLTGDSLLDAGIISAVERWVFQPARLDTKPVGSWFDYTLTLYDSPRPPTPDTVHPLRVIGARTDVTELFVDGIRLDSAGITVREVIPPDTVHPLRVIGARTDVTELFVDGIRLDSAGITVPEVTTPDMVHPLRVIGARTGETVVSVDGIRVDSAITVPEVPTPDTVHRPTFTPFTEPPRLLNSDEINALLRDEYPRSLRDQDVRYTVIVWHHIDATGKVEHALVQQSSGHEELDRLALRAASASRFSPARNVDQDVAVWIQIPVRFEAR